MATWEPSQPLVSGLIAFLIPAATTAAAPAPTRAEAKFEIKFLENMIDHHAMAVMMAKMCQDRAIHDDLRALCSQIEENQAEEIVQMQSWLKNWYGIAYEPRTTPKMDRQMEKLDALDGANFEIVFMKMMIEHHEQAIREGDECVERAFHPELIQLCQNIIWTQGEETQTMRTWLSEWYGIEPHGGTGHR